MQLLPARTQADVERARRETRSLAATLHFPRDETEMVALAVCELATNLVRYGKAGTISLRALVDNGRVGIEIKSADAGPGIAEVDLALADGFSTGGGLGSGLPGVRRLMDEFQIRTSPQGTHIVCCKWIPRS